jgi:hypothetical protein
MTGKGICEHLVRVAIIEDIDLLDIEKKHKLTVRCARIKNLEVSKGEDFD